MFLEAVLGSSGGGELNFSTDETVIGTWIDGKPLYRKIIYNNGSNIGNSHNLSSLNVKDVLFSVAYSMDYIYYYNIVGGMANSSGSKQILFNKNTSTLEFYNFPSGATTFWLVIYYTKTTD